MRRALPFLLLALAACGEPVADDHYANRASGAREASPPPATEAVPVRVGELGPNFDACTAVGTTRNLEPGAALNVRSAPFDSAAESGAIAAGGRFFICTRSHDQKWFGIVYDESGALGPRCGVSAPLAARRAYEGPCRSGWVASPFVKLISGIDQPPPAQ
jgi:hypothetical protein